MANKGKITGAISTAYNDLSPRAKSFVSLAGIIVGGIIVYKLYKGSQGAISRFNSRDELKDTADELQQANQNSSTRQTITNTQASIFANNIYESMDGWGTYEETIVDTFKKLKNNADFLAVNKAYGTRTVFSRTWFVPDQTSTMIPALHDELSQYWIDEVNKILDNKGITYRI